jgi:hypothetical protein
VQFASLELITQVEERLGLPRGWFLVRAGFVEHDAWPLPERLVTTCILREDDVAAQLSAAMALGLGVRLYNEQHEVPDEPDTTEEQWIMELYPAAPEQAAW